MRNTNLKTLMFMALCCDLGLLAKKIISPAANVITDSLHIPGGISTSFSLMFLVIAASLVSFPGCAAVMGTVQSVLALCLGMTGSMGILAPIGYILPGVMIDLIMSVCKRLSGSPESGILLSSAAASLTASLTANLIVFRLRGIVLLLYLLISATSGSLCGLLAQRVTARLKCIFLQEGFY